MSSRHAQSEQNQWINKEILGDTAEMPIFYFFPIFDIVLVNYVIWLQRKPISYFFHVLLIRFLGYV